MPADRACACDGTGIVFASGDSGALCEDGATAGADCGMRLGGAGGVEGGETGVCRLEGEGDGLLEFEGWVHGGRRAGSARDVVVARRGHCA